jgi:hypothetical protein
VHVVSEVVGFDAARTVAHLDMQIIVYVDIMRNGDIEHLARLHEEGEIAGPRRPSCSRHGVG